MTLLSGALNAAKRDWTSATFPIRDNDAGYQAASRSACPLCDEFSAALPDS
jgi:hypothetical protein